MKLKLVVALLATVLSLGAVVPLCAAEDPKQDAHQEDAYGGGDKATPSHTRHTYADAPAPALGQSYNIPVLKRTMPWPEGTTLAQLAAQAATQRQALKRGSGDERALWERVLASVRARQAITNRRRARVTKRQAPAGQARRGHLDAVQAEPLGHYGEYEHEHYGGPHAHVGRSFTGLTAYDQPGAFSFTPPDQGLCVGNGFILETVNTMLRVYTEDGRPLTPPLDTNAFSGLAPYYNVTSDQYGPSLYDPSCWFDIKSRRWFHVVATADLDPNTGIATGPAWLDVAVSTSSTPTGAWNYFRVPAANDGSQGTPDLGCSGGSCAPDYPQMAVWDQALVITVNEFAVDESDFYGALVYTLDKQALVQGLATVNTALVNPGDTGNDIGLIYTLIPARQSSACELRNEFLMSTPPAVVFGDSVDTLLLLRLRGTASLSTANPLVTLEWVEPGVKLPFQYTYPPEATQKPGSIPLGTTYYGATDVTLLTTRYAAMNSVAFVDDKLYAAWGPEVEGVAGAAWALVDPRRPARALDSGRISMPDGNHLLFPSLAVRAGGEGVMAVSVSGPDYYPSPAYALLTRHGLGPVKLLAKGVGPLDDFTGYEDAITYGPPGSARFGDYTAALVDETGAFWVASEWVAQSCSVAQFNGTAPTYAGADPTCGGTRTLVTNWATRLSKVEVFN